MIFKATYKRKNKRNITKIIEVDCPILAQSWVTAIATAFIRTKNDEILIRLEQVEKGD